MLVRVSAFILAFILAVASLSAADSKPVFSSPVVTPATPGHAVAIDVDITGAEVLYLIAADGRDGFGCDWADWIEPKLIGPDGEQKLTDLKWHAASTGFGEVRVNRNAGGGSLRVAGQSIEHGIGTHANSTIQFALPSGHGFTRFQARAGLDNGGTDQGGCGAGSSVQFFVFTQAPPAAFLASVTGDGSSAASHEADAAISQLDIHPDVDAALFAAEPMMFNPTNIDIDHLGRVWVCEVINYRRFRNGDQPEREAGDRILIVEDTDHDGRADKTHVFYQDRKIDSAHGICVMPTADGKGTKALVSAGDSVFYLIDDDGDLKADRTETLFTGIQGTQHDHGIHAFVFGPDGKLYFNFGNAGKEIRDKDGKPITDKAGNVVNDQRKPYQEGMVFRCNPDGSEFETLGWDFRNNWEVAVDSFGTLWQSDNDDDGNRGVRINFVMEFGSYGYRDALTGAGWRDPRTGMHEEIPKRHWHLNDPGTIPNLLQTGAGSPTGICVYEGSALPEVFQNEIIHCDAGPSIVRAYPVETDGAGYTAEIVNLLDGSQRNKWFRPSDVCVAPDGSLIVADWYDPGVGGHRMQDVEHGRLFRVTAKGASDTYEVPAVDVSTADGAAQALQSPNPATRYMAWTALQAMGADAEPALQKLYQSDNPRFRARALWALGKLGLGDAKTRDIVLDAVSDQDPNIRITALRLGRQLADTVDLDDMKYAINLWDASPAVRREILIGLRELDIPEVPEAWTALALQYDGQDRWYLEALGLAADGRWDACLGHWLKSFGEAWEQKAARDIIWRSRSTGTPALLATLIRRPETPVDELPRYFRAFDFQADSDVKRAALTELAFGDSDADAGRSALVRSEAINRLPAFDIKGSPKYAEALASILDGVRGTEQFVRLVDRFSVADRYEDLVALAIENPQSQTAVEAIKALLNKNQRPRLRAALSDDDSQRSASLAAAIGIAGDGRGVPLLMEIVEDKSAPLPLRRESIAALSLIRPGALELEKLANKGEYDSSLKPALAAALNGTQWKDIKERIAKVFPPPPGKAGKPLPSLDDLAARTGDLGKGRVVFQTVGTCNKCHVVNGEGTEVGPNLSEIGNKLSKKAMLESIIYPSAGISHNYESYSILTADGQVLTGLLVSESADEVKLKDAKGIIRTIKTDDIDEKARQTISLMPADLVKSLTVDELVDVVEYLMTLKKQDRTAAVMP